ncbi:MAG: hypothetical protein QXI42_11985 [Thermoproteota archaeon]
MRGIKGFDTLQALAVEIPGSSPYWLHPQLPSSLKEGVSCSF